MALWGNSDNVGSAGTVSLNYSTGVVTGDGTNFGGAVGSGATGDIIRFGERSGTYFGDAVIVSIASTEECTIGSTMGLSGAAIAGVEFTVAQCPTSEVLDEHYSEKKTDFDSFVYGVSGVGVSVSNDNDVYDAYRPGHAGWVGVTTYNDSDGNLRVKSEVLVAMSGISTGNAPAFPGGAV